MLTKNCILAFESSCDDSSVALVSENGDVLFHLAKSQANIHERFGGVVPEVAAREHALDLPDLLLQFQKKINLSELTLKAVAATCGPGLIGPLLVAQSLGQGYAAALKVPFVGVHHLRGHLASVLIDEKNDEDLRRKAARVFPALTLLVSGGHSQILWVEEDLSARILFSTLDDAAGECFDKGAKILGLSYPGGPSIEHAILDKKNQAKFSEEKSSHYFKLLPVLQISEGFSFSGLKTAFRNIVQKADLALDQVELAAALEKSIVGQLLKGLEKVFSGLGADEKRALKSFQVCGGVAANKKLNAGLKDWAAAHALPFLSPSLKYSSDNAAMIAVAAWIQNPKWILKDVEARIPL